jgi:hypothetical protein
VNKSNRTDRNLNNIRDRDIIKGWQAKLFRRGDANGRAFIDYTFPTEDGAKGRLQVPRSEIRHCKRLLDGFCDLMALFPAGTANDEARIAFLEKLASRHHGKVEVFPIHPGFMNKDCFAMWDFLIHADGRRTPIPSSGGKAAYSDTKGSFAGSDKNVLRLARHSTYLAFAIGVAFAAPLPSYLRLRGNTTSRDKPVLTETAVFNFSGKSSSGKSSAALAALSLVGSPDRAGMVNFTERGLVEYAADYNDLLTVLDDTEKSTSTADLVKALRLMVHVLPGGRSKHISKGVDQTKFSQLSWRSFGLSSSPVAIRTLAQQHGWAMSAGDMVRLFDIHVPPASRGGIFDRIDIKGSGRAKRSVRLIKQLEQGYLHNQGQIFPKWIVYLLANDASSEIAAAANKFVKKVRADHEGWERRFAQKFGLVYAAMKLGVDMDLLPWPKGLPLKVAKKCYRRARNAAIMPTEGQKHFVERLIKVIVTPGRVADVHKGNSKRPVKLRSGCLGIKYRRGGQSKVGIFDAAIMKLLKTKKAKSSAMSALAKAHVVSRGHGHAGTVQRHIPIRLAGREIKSPKVWELDLKRLKKFAMR